MTVSAESQHFNCLGILSIYGIQICSFLFKLLLFFFVFFFGGGAMFCLFIYYFIHSFFPHNYTVINKHVVSVHFLVVWHCGSVTEMGTNALHQIQGLYGVISLPWCNVKIELLPQLGISQGQEKIMIIITVIDLLYHVCKRSKPRCMLLILLPPVRV